MSNIINDNERETNPSESHTPWREHNTGGSFKSFRSECLHTPLSFKTASSFTYPIEQSVFRVPVERGEQNKPIYQQHETNQKKFPPGIQGVTNNCNTCYSGYCGTIIPPYFRPADTSCPRNSLKYYDPLYFYPQKEIKERRKKYYKKLLNKYKKFIKH